MCGRFGLSRPDKLDLKQYGVAGFPMPPRFNIAPGTDVLAVRARADGREASLLRWGLIPWWSRDPTIGARTVNARAESAWEKPAFRDPMVKRRCLLPADFFYEWQVVPGRRVKQPYAVALATREPFALGGLWDFWRPRAPVAAAAAGVASCTILTTEPNLLLAPIHDRMPVIVPREAFAAWLDPRTPRPAVEDLLRPFPADLMRAWMVGLRVNSAAEDDPGLIEALTV